MATYDTSTDRYKHITKHTWQALLSFYNETFSCKERRSQKTIGQGIKEPKWIFRGQGQDEPLTTSLDRAFAKYGIPKPKKGKDQQKENVKCEKIRRSIEQALLRSFMRKAHHYLPTVPETDDLIEWLATMRHYGAPIRMLDWTYSFYVAVYNAVENWNPKAKEKGEQKNVKKQPEDKDTTWPVISVLDAASFKPDRKLYNKEKRAPRSIDKARHEQNNVLKDLMNTRSPRALVYNATGFRLNARLIAQQGTFLVQGSLAKTFSENLQKSLDANPRTLIYHIELRIDKKERDTILRELNNMNINHATLYPDLEGLAKSLERHMAYPEHWGLNIKKEYR